MNNHDHLLEMLRYVFHVTQTTEPGTRMHSDARYQLVKIIAELTIAGVSVQEINSHLV